MEELISSQKSLWKFGLSNTEKSQSGHASGGNRFTGCNILSPLFLSLPSFLYSLSCSLRDCAFIWGLEILQVFSQVTCSLWEDLTTVLYLRLLATNYKSNSLLSQQSWNIKKKVVSVVSVQFKCFNMVKWISLSLCLSNTFPLYLKR